MAEDHKSNIARYLRTKYTLPVDAADDDIIRYARKENPDEVKAIEYAAYNNKPDTTPEPPKSLLGRAVAKLEDVGNTINANTEMFTNEKLSNHKGAYDEQASIIANRGLKKVTEAVKPFGEKLDSILDKISGIGDVLGKIDPAAQAAFNAGTAPVQNTLENAAGLVPRTAAQTAFAGLTLPFAEIEGIGNALTSAGKRLMPRAAALTERTSMNALRRVSEMYPESKLARMLDNMTRGSVAEQRFNIINEAAINTERRVIGKEGMTEAENAIGDKNISQINEKLGHDVNEVISGQNALEDTEKKLRLNTLNESASARQDLQEELKAKQTQIKALAQEKRHAIMMTEAHQSAIEADVATNKALGMANKDAQAGEVGRRTQQAVQEAQNKVSVLYDKTHALGRLVVADVTPLNASFGEMREGLLAKLKVLPEDSTAQKVLGMLEQGTQETPMSVEAVDLFTQSKDKGLKKIGEEAAQKKPKTLSDMMQLYSDLNTMYRNKGDRMYGKAAVKVRQYIRTFEDVPWTKAVIDSWDSARGAQSHLSATYENKTIEGLLKIANEGNAGTLFSKLVESGGESTMPLTRFIQVAPEEAQNIVRRESLGRAFEAISKAKPGKASGALDAFIEKTGQGNVELLHNGVDLDGLSKLATLRDSTARVEAEVPEIAEQISKTQKSITKVIEDTKKALLDSHARESGAREVAWSKEAVLQEKARAAAVAERQATVTRIANGIEAIDKALPIRAKVSTRAGEVGQVVVEGMRKDDDYSNAAIGGGAGALAAGYGLKAMGFTQLGNTTGGIGAASIVFGLAKKSPQAMAKLYYSEAGRALITRIASAPNATEAAKALLELGDTLKNPGVYAMIKPKMGDTAPIKQETKKNPLGALSGLSKTKEVPQPVNNKADITDPWNHGDAALESLPDENYQNPVEEGPNEGN